MDNFYRLFRFDRKVKRKGIYEMFESEIEKDFTKTTVESIATAEKYVQLRQLNQAKSVITSGLSKEPNSPYLWAARAFLHLFESNHHSAIDDFKEALSLGGDNYIFYAEIGNSCNAINNFKGAELSLSISLDTKPPIIYTDDEILKAKMKFIKTKENYEVLFSNRAAAKLGLNDFEGCMADCTMAKTYNPNFQGYKLVLGILLYKQGHKNESLNFIREAAENGYQPAKAVLQQFFGLSK